MPGEQLFAMVFVLGMFAGVFVIFLAMRQRSHLLEMQHREKMAMIERGLTPVPERNRVQALIQGPGGQVLRARAGSFASRSQAVGIILIGLGLGFMSIVGIAAGAPEVGVGLGGAVIVVGIAFIVNGVLTRPSHAPVYEHVQNDPKPPSDPPL